MIFTPRETMPSAHSQKVEHTPSHALFEKSLAADASGSKSAGPPGSSVKELGDRRVSEDHRGERAGALASPQGRQPHAPPLGAQGQRPSSDRMGGQGGGILQSNPAVLET